MSLEISFNNFRAHASGSYKFSDNSFVLLAGPSGAGKTTILEGIVYVLYGKVRRPYTFGTKTCTVNLKLDDIDITRSSSPKRLIVKRGKRKYEDNEAQSIINKVLLPCSQFMASSYIKQKLDSSLISMSPSEQLALVEDIAFSDSDYSEINSKINKFISSLKEDQSKCMSQIDLLNSQKSTRKKLDVMEVPDLSTFRLEYDETSLSSLTNALEETVAEVNQREEKISVLQESLDKLSDESTESLLSKELELVSELSSIDMKTSYLDKSIPPEELLLLEIEVDEQTEKLKALQLKSQKAAIKKEYEERYQAQLKTYRDELAKYQKFVLSEAELKERQDKLGLKVVKNSYTKEYCAKKLKTMLDKLEASVYLQNKRIKTTKGIKTHLTRKKKELRDLLEKKKEELRELQDQAVIEKISATSYTCPSCKANLYFHESKLQKVKAKKNKKPADRLVNDKIFETAEVREELELAELYLSEVDTLDAVMAGNAILEDEKSEIESSLASHKNFVQEVDELRKMIDEEIMPPEIENLEEVYFNLRDQVKAQGKIENQSVGKIEMRIKDVLQQLEDHHRNEAQRGILVQEKQQVEMDLYNLRKELGRAKNMEDETRQIIDEIEYEKQEMEECRVFIISIQEAVLQVKEYETYLSGVKEREEVEKKLADLEKKEKEITRKISKTLEIKKLCNEAEVLALSSTLRKINENAKVYLDQIFQDDKILVRLDSVKETTRGAKIQINTQIIYKGHLYDTVDQFSGGERDRVNLAFILGVNELLESRMLILDECLSSLNSEINMEILDLLKKNCQNKLILVTGHKTVSGLFDEVCEI